MCMCRLFFCSVFGEFKAPPIGLECELQRFESFSVDPSGRNFLETMQRKTEEKKIVFVQVDKALNWVNVTICTVVS